MVRERHAWAGVFPDLLEGEYLTHSEQPGRSIEFNIVSGRVTEVDWRPYPGWGSSRPEPC